MTVYHSAFVKKIFILFEINQNNMTSDVVMFYTLFLVNQDKREIK